MKILSIGTDRKLFEEGSDVRARAVEYGARVEEMHIVVFALQSLGLQPTKISPNVWIYPTNSVSRALYIFDAWRLGKKIVENRKLNPNDSLITLQDPFEVGLAGYLVKKSTSLPIHSQVHIDFFSSYYRSETVRNRFHFCLGKFILRRSAAIRVVSQKIADFLIGAMKLPKQKISVLPIHIDSARYEKREIKTDLHKKYPSFDFIFLSASRLEKQKNIPLAISAFKKFVKKFPNAGLVIVGSGSQKERLKRQAADCPNIIFESWSSDLASYYASADTFILSSNYEGWGMTVVEACATGLPVIMTDVGCAGEFLVDHDNGLVMPVNNENALLKAMTELRENTDLRTSISYRAVKSMLRLMSRNEYLRLTEESWKLALAQHSQNKKLLIITQKVDANDDVLGFFHEWIREFSKHFKKVKVLCLSKHEYNLPLNVEVISLGKEKGYSRMRRTWNFYKYCIGKSREYDAVFVHMNPIYVVIAGIFWKLLGKKAALWYTHKQVDFKLRLAEKFCDHIFTASKESFRLQSRKVAVTGHGIDTNVFSPAEHREKAGKLSMITIGRISAVKDYETFIEAIELLKNGTEIEGKIAGSPLTDADKEYFEKLKENVHDRKLDSVVSFLGSIPNRKIANYLRASDLFANMSHTGSLDKAVLEAVATCVPAFTCNEAFIEFMRPYSERFIFEKKNPNSLAEKIKNYLKLPEEDKTKILSELRGKVVCEHSLEPLIKRMSKIILDQ